MNILRWKRLANWVNAGGLWCGFIGSRWLFNCLQSLVTFCSYRSNVSEKPNLLPWAFRGRAATPTARGWVPERSAISGRMRPRGRFTPPGDSRPPPSLRAASAGDRKEPGAYSPRRWGGAPQHSAIAGIAKRRSRECEGIGKARAHAPEVEVPKCPPRFGQAALFAAGSGFDSCIFHW